MVEDRHEQRVSAEQVLFLENFNAGEWTKIGLVILQVNTYHEGIQRCRHHAALNGGVAVAEYKVLSLQSGVRNVVAPTTMQTTTETGNQYANQMAADLQEQSGTPRSLRINLDNGTSTTSTYSSGGDSASIPFTILDVQCSVLTRIEGAQPSAQENGQTSGKDAERALMPLGGTWYCTRSAAPERAACYRRRNICTAESQHIAAETGRKTVAPCNPQERVHCITFGTSGEHATDYACSPTPAACDAQRKSRLEDVGSAHISNCSEW